MNTQPKKSSLLPLSGPKKAALAGLFLLAGAICISGTFFAVYSAVYSIQIPIFSAQIPGLLFGLAVLYLGIRYIVSLFHLKNELANPDSHFSWSNFKKK